MPIRSVEVWVTTYGQRSQRSSDPSFSKLLHRIPFNILQKYLLSDLPSYSPFILVVFGKYGRVDPRSEFVER